MTNQHPDDTRFNSTIGLIIVNETGKVIYANDMAMKLAFDGQNIGLGMPIPIQISTGGMAKLNARDTENNLATPVIVSSERFECEGHNFRVLTIFGKEPGSNATIHDEIRGKSLGAVFSDILESLLIVDAITGNIIWNNSCSAQILGFRGESLAGRPFSDLFPPGSEIKADNVLNELVCADGVFVTQSFARGDGGITYMDLTASLIPWEGESTAILVVLREAAERKQLEELRLEAARLNSFSELSAGVAHHFNNMLQVIIGFAGLAQSELESGKTTRIKHKLDQIIASSNEAASAIRSLQDFARCGLPMACTYQEVVNLKTLAKRAANLGALWWKTQPDNSEATVSIETDLDQDCYARVNPDRILEVMINLIKNGLESISGNGVVTVGTRKGKSESIFYVRDTGEGIRPDDLRRIFDPFWTTKGPRKSGLGLPSALGIVKQNNGEITVETKNGGGTTFSVRFQSADLSPDVEIFAPQPENAMNVSVLVIDEETKVLELMTSGLELEGFTVLASSNITNGLKILDQTSVDIIICDSGSNDLSGWDLGRTLKDRYENSDQGKPYLILLTAWGVAQNQKTKPESTGVDAMMAKPVPIRDLISKIREILSQRT